MSSCQQSPSASELIEQGNQLCVRWAWIIRQEQEKAEGEWTDGGGDEDQKCYAGLPANTVMQAVQRGRARADGQSEIGPSKEDVKVATACLVRVQCLAVFNVLHGYVECSRGPAAEARQDVSKRDDHATGRRCQRYSCAQKLGMQLAGGEGTDDLRRWGAQRDKTECDSLLPLKEISIRRLAVGWTERGFGGGFFGGGRRG